MYFYLPTNNISEISTSHIDHFFSMRVKPNDKIVTTDLNGLMRKIKITEIDKKNKNIKFEILESRYEIQKIQKNILIQAITDKTYLEKLVEIAPHANIDIIYLFYSKYSPSTKITLDRLERIMHRSCEQAQKLYKLEIKIINQIDLNKLLDNYQPIILEVNSVMKSENISFKNYPSLKIFNFK